MKVAIMSKTLFVKGQSGNPKGSPKGGFPKRKKARLKVQEILDMLDFKPFEEMVNLIRTTKKDQVKADLLMDLCSYLAPKLKHVEISGDNENPFVINLQLQPGKKRLEFSQMIENVIEDDDGELIEG